MINLHYKCRVKFPYIQRYLTTYVSYEQFHATEM
jgi:hypothetical protein